MITFITKTHSGYCQTEPRLADSVSNKSFISHILISGNKKTKPWIVTRECSFAVGDSVLDINKEMLLSKNRIFNTKLFVKTDISYANDTIKIDLIERWYTYPFPAFDITDRNFNEWWQTRDKDWSRVNYSLAFTQMNMRGRNETLKLNFQGGFNKKIEFKYNFPFIDKNRHLGLGFSVSYIVDKQVGYMTENNTLKFTAIEGNGRFRFSAAMGMSYRKFFYQTHSWGLGYYQNNVPDTIALLNPNYFGNGATKQRFIAVQYNFTDDQRDIVFYPLNGHFFNLSISKYGLSPLENINMWIMNVNAAYFKHLGKKFYGSISYSQKISTPVNQPYIYSNSLGYGSNYVSGYELYIIDGQHHSLLKSNLRKKVWGFEKRFNWIPIKQFNSISFQVFLRAFSDTGIAVDNSRYNKGNKGLANRILWGNGLGIDFVSYYDTVLRFEYTINHMQETGFFIHYRSML